MLASPLPIYTKSLPCSLKKLNNTKTIPNSVSSILAKLDAALSKDEIKPNDLLEVQEWLNEMRKNELRKPGNPNFREYLRLDFIEQLNNSGINSGNIAEIGGPFNSFSEKMTGYDFEFISLYPVKDNKKVLVADIGQADHIEGERYDAIFSVSVFEHIAKPWKAAEHMSRLLKPSGIVYHAAPFSYFYHGAPADFWRFTPDAFEVMFSSLKTVKSEFFGDNRRRDNRGSDYNPVDRDGGPQFSVDAFGGWRENWYTIYVGQKDSSVLQHKIDVAKGQAILNLMKTKIDQGVSDSEAAKQVSKVSAKLFINQDQELSVVEEHSANMLTTEEEALHVWKKRVVNETRLRPSYNRFVMAKRTGWI